MMATRFDLFDLTKQCSAEELSKMPTMEQLIVANRIRNQQMLQMLGLSADINSRHVTPKQQNTKKSKKKVQNTDVDWTPDLTAEEDSVNAETLTRKHSSTATRKSNNKPFAPQANPGTSASSSSTVLPATVANTPLTKSAKCRIRKTTAHTTSVTSLALDADKPTSPSNIYPDPNSQQNQSAQKKTTSASASEATTVPPASVQPFTGFTAEQIEAARRRSIEARNRKESIVSLMRSKIVNKDDLAIIEPVERNVLQVVLKRRKQESKEQQKAEQRNEFAGRYMRRNVSRKNYHESSEDDEILDEDMIYNFHCDKCKMDYEGHRICPIHHDASDKAELDYRSHGYNSMKSLPEGMLLKESPIPGTGRSVFTGQFTTLRKDMIYGPYEGVKIYNEREAHQSGYCWQIYCKRKISHWIDARQVRRSNWLRYINCAATMDQQNMCAYQVGQNIYYRTVVDIIPATELLVWYGDDYARELGLFSVAFMASINSITINGVDLACWDCQLEFRCRQLLNQHKFTTHDSVNSNIVAVVGKTRSFTNTGGTRPILGSVAKPGVVAHKTRIVASVGTRRPSIDVSPCSTRSCARSYKLHESSAGSNDGCGISDSCVIDSAVNKCQVTVGSGDAGVLFSAVLSSVVVTDDGRRFQCSTCCKLFKMGSHLTQHTRIHTGEKPFACTRCGQRFSRSGNLTKHSRIHTGEKPFGCTTCGQKFTENSDLIKHSRIHTGEKPFGCTACGQKFTQNSNLTKHSRIHTGEKPFGCITCGQKFTQNSDLSRHSRIHMSEKQFGCTTCGQKFTQNTSLIRHSLIHTGVKPFVCIACGKRFAQRAEFTRHCRIHSDEKPFECTTYGHRFSQSSHLHTHCRIHTKEKPFECTACGQRFTQSSHLNTHCRIHTEEKPFECTTCGKRFTASGHLTRHSRIHTGEKPFECTTCGKWFSSSSHLARHSRIHWGKTVTVHV